MKPTKSIIAAIFIMFAVLQNGKSQSFWEWSDPMPLTDSLSDNTNPFLLRTWEPSDQQVFMAWEKSTDSVSTAISLDNIFDEFPAEIVLSDPGVNYTNPILLSAHQYPPTDSIFYLFYETDQNGSKDIYYVIYLIDGSFSTPVAFATTQYDDIELDVGGSAFSKGKYIKTELVWSSNGNIYNSSFVIESGQQSFTEAIMVDSLQCSMPVFSEMDASLFYLKIDTPEEKHVYRAHKINDEWNTELLYDLGNSENIKTDKCLSNYTIWTAYIDSTWKLVMNDYMPFYTFEIEKETAFEPAIIGNAIIVKQGGPYEYVHIAFPYPDNGYDEIFMNPDPNGTSFENFTNSGVENRNAGFFLGEDLNPSCFYIYLVWESMRNGYWQIWSSKKLLCIGAIGESEIAASFLNIHPSPFTHETTLEFTLNSRSDAAIDVYDNRGVLITRIAAGSFDPGTHQLRWNADGLAAGMYIIKMTVGGKTYTSKIVKSH